MRRIHFDGGLRKQLVCIVDESTNFVSIARRDFIDDNLGYEYEALLMALRYVQKILPQGEPVCFVGDNLEVIRWMRAFNFHEENSQIKRICGRVLREVERDYIVSHEWVKRHRNLAGRVLEFHTRRSSKPREFIATWYPCPECEFISLLPKETSENHYNNHIVI